MVRSLLLAVDQSEKVSVMTPFSDMAIDAPMNESSEVSYGVLDVALGLADDEFLMGHRHSEWLGLSPFLEEDLTMASIAQDEFGHARALYGLIWPTWVDRNALVVRRHPGAWRSCSFTELGDLSWEASFVRHVIYDVTEAHRWKSLARRWTGAEMAALVDQVLAEERFHARHATDLLTRLGHGGALAHERLAVGVSLIAPHLGGLLSDLLPGEQDEAIRQLCEVFACGTVPFDYQPFPEPAHRSDRTVRSESFASVQHSLLEVISNDPSANW
jgi:phenylacetate-CoA oxygenase PaaI subunit